LANGAVMKSLGASADIWLGRFDGSKYVPPAGSQDTEGDRAPAATLPAPPPRHEPEVAEAAKAAKPSGYPVYGADAGVLCHVMTPEGAHDALKEARDLAGPVERIALLRNNEKLLTKLAQRRDDAGKWAREQLQTMAMAAAAA
jgi:hypothetical protein